MRIFILTIIIGYSALLNAQITMDTHGTQNDLIKSEKFPGVIEYRISEDSSIMIFSQTFPNLKAPSYVDTLKISSISHNKDVYRYIAEVKGISMLVMMWRDEPLVSYSYYDNSHVLIYGNLKYPHLND